MTLHLGVFHIVTGKCVEATRLGWGFHWMWDDYSKPKIALVGFGWVWRLRHRSKAVPVGRRWYTAATRYDE